MTNFQERIAYTGDLLPLLQDVCADYHLGDYLTHTMIEIGYEDFNLRLQTSGATYFVKIFAHSRSIDECQRYVAILSHVLAAGVRTPALYPLADGQYLYDKRPNNQSVRLMVMEYIEGQTFYDQGRAPTENELVRITKEAAKINQIAYRPTALFDGWSIAQCATVFADNSRYLNDSDKAMIEPLVAEYQKLEINALPHCLVHGDMIATNILQTAQDELYVLDFAVANYYPRISELAVILSGYHLEDSPSSFTQNQALVLNTYEKYIPLTPQEKDLIPLFTQLAYAMHVMGAAGEKAKGNTSAENQQWFDLGRKGLILMHTHTNRESP